MSKNFTNLKTICYKHFIINFKSYILSEIFCIPSISYKNMDKKLYPEASKILDSMEEFLPELWGFPAYN